MKNFYTLALAAAVALSASAADVVSPVKGGLKLKQTREMLTPVESLEVMKAPVARKAPAKIAAENVYGEYNWNFLDLIEYQEDVCQVEVFDTEDADLNMGIYGLWGDDVIGGVYDPATSTFTITPYEIRELDANTSTGTVHVSAQIAIWKIDESGEDFDYTDEPFVFTFDENGATAPEDFIFSIAAVKTDGSNELAGFFFIGAYNALEKQNWIDLPDATFVDGIQPAFFLKEETTFTSMIKTQVMEGTSYLRFTNPWNGTWSALFPEDEDPNTYYMELDCADPEYVIMPLTYSGVSDGTYGIYIGGLAYLAGYDKESFAQTQYASQTITLKDNVITFAPKSLGEVSTGEPTKLYIMPNFLSTITLPEGWNSDANGVESVVADNNAPVEYFNLQGIRVANPENGIFIRRQGNKTVKVVK